MALTNFPNGASSFGMPLIGLTTGNVFFVHNASGSNSNTGTDADNPFADIDYAIGQCTASNGDIIFAMPGHYEAVIGASDILFDVAGVTLIGLGSGTDMPQIDYTLAAGEVHISATSVTIQNINFHANVTDVLIGIETAATADNFTIRGCKFDVETTTTDEFTYCIDIVAGCNFGLIEDCFFDMGLGGATGAIHLNGTSTDLTVLGNSIKGDYGTACIVGSTGASTNIDIGNNILVNGSGTNLNGEPCIELNGNSTGSIWNNYVVCNVGTVAASIVSALSLLYENYYNEDISSSGTGVVVGTASGDDA